MTFIQTASILKRRKENWNGSSSAISYVTYGYIKFVRYFGLIKKVLWFNDKHTWTHHQRHELL